MFEKHRKIQVASFQIQLIRMLKASFSIPHLSLLPPSLCFTWTPNSALRKDYNQLQEKKLMEDTRTPLFYLPENIKCRHSSNLLAWVGFIWFINLIWFDFGWWCLKNYLMSNNFYETTQLEVGRHLVNVFRLNVTELSKRAAIFISSTFPSSILKLQSRTCCNAYLFI